MKLIARLLRAAMYSAMFAGAFLVLVTWTLVSISLARSFGLPEWQEIALGGSLLVSPIIIGLGWIASGDGDDA